MADKILMQNYIPFIIYLNKYLALSSIILFLF